MRKRYVEKLSFYKLLEELNGLPDECAITPLFIDKVNDKKLEFVDFYVNFTRHYLDENDNEDALFTLLFMYKSKNVRLCSQARFAFEIDLRDFELTQFCFNSKILTVSDFFQAALGESVEFTQSLTKVQNSDNERFALMQT